MTKKPMTKKEVTVTEYFKESRIIHLYASRDAAQGFTEFGTLWTGADLGSANPPPDYYMLIVDARFDFDEVIEYIQNYETK